MSKGNMSKGVAFEHSKKKKFYLPNIVKLKTYNC